MNDTWEFDGNDWRQVTAAVSPPPRYYPSLTYDSHRQRIVLFGGVGSGGPLNDTWEYDGFNWTQASPPSFPGPCSRFSMAYDPNRRRVVVRGQRREPGDGECSIAQQTWEYDGVTWRQVVTPTQPPDSGHSNWHTAFTWDATAARLLYFLDDAVWTYDGMDWSPLGTFSCGIEGITVDNGRSSSVFTRALDPDNARQFDVTYEWQGPGTCPRSVSHSNYPPARTSNGNVPAVYFACTGPR